MDSQLNNMLRRILKNQITLMKEIGKKSAGQRQMEGCQQGPLSDAFFGSSSGAQTNIENAIRDSEAVIVGIIR